MNDRETKVLTAFAISAGVGILAIPIGLYFTEKKKADAEIEKAKIQKEYPAEYWQAKEAKAKADAEVKKAKIESDERLELDRRNRQDEEMARKREFEKNAPAEYWEQQRIAEEEKTKRELNRQRYQAEMETAKQHREAIKAGIDAAEKAVRYTR